MGLRATYTTNGSTIGDDYPRHKEYYITSADLHVLARETRFRIHSSLLDQESGYWKDEIAKSDPSGEGKRMIGFHESAPIIIDESPNDFARFLWVFYNPRYGIYRTSPRQWVVILRLATKWDCPKIREFAISHIKKIEMETFKKIKVFKRYNVPEEEIFSLYVELASRERLLNREEFSVLDDDTKFCVARAREMLRGAHAHSHPPSEGSDASSSASSLGEGLSHREKSRIVAEAFGVPFIEDFGSESEGEPEGSRPVSPFDFPTP